MAQDQEQDLSAIAWPGFVDILSAVIIFFVFFMMIIAAALFFHVKIYVSKVESTPVESLEEKQTAASDEEIQLDQVQIEFAASKDQNVSFDQTQRELVIFFDQKAITTAPDLAAYQEALFNKAVADADQS